MSITIFENSQKSLPIAAKTTKRKQRDELTTEATKPFTGSLPVAIASRVREIGALLELAPMLRR